MKIGDGIFVKTREGLGKMLNLGRYFLKVSSVDFISDYKNVIEKCNRENKDF